ncbi:MAG TPA: hypothetical protein VFG50_04405, partial [Rhodothermales bacterium]|nr:hypothetical protein [Rhodothermales bacterium]
TDEGNIDLHAPKGTIDIKAKAIKMESTGDTTLKAANFKGDVQANWEVAAKANMKLEAKMNLSQKGGMGLVSDGGMNHNIMALNVKSEGDLTNEMSSKAMVNVKGTALTNITGGIVKIN